MEDTSSAKEVTSHATPFYFPTSFHGVIRAVLRCLGFQQNPISCPKEDDDDDNNIQHASQKEAGSTPSPTTDCSDPPADPPSTTLTGDDGAPVIALFTPKRPGTGGGRGPQIN
ncbi:hypothetical protein V6N13_012470 [Hibiscus sabdariffa]|uniref:Uncharacterized protein n=2 Tax=Hibiscus sabdariffa TaxID=183260 RepID=A0ABR1Z6K6_9ROSI